MSDIREKVIKIVQENLDVEEAKITDDANFINDLGADSLDQVELVMALEEEFDIEISDDEATKITTVGEAISHIEAAKSQKLF